MLGLLLFASAVAAPPLIPGLPNEIVGEVCFRATDGVKTDYDPDGPTFHQPEFALAVAGYRLDNYHVAELRQFCKDQVTVIRYIGLRGRELKASNRR